MVMILTKLETPRVPNFIIHETKARRREDGFKESAKTSIADLTEEQLREIGKEWTEALVTRAADIRASNAGD